MTNGEFVGRQAELAAFAALLEPSSTYRVLAVYGFGGVGKSTFVEQCCKIAIRQSMSVALVNSRRLMEPEHGHEYPAAVEAMVLLEQALRNGGMKAALFAKKLRRYRKLHSSLTRKFTGAESAAVAAILQVGLSAIRAGATVFPLAAPLNEVLTPELATQVGNVIAGYRRQADRYLLAQPVEVLTAALVRDINDIASRRSQRLVIAFDEFQLLPIRAEYWLRNLFHGDYGALESRVLLVLSGRHALSQDWTSRGQAGEPSRILELRLEQFSEEEVVEYLVQRSSIDAATARAVALGLGATYRVPLVLRLLVADPQRLPQHATGNGHLGMLADDLVDRLLDASPTSREHRQLALVISVARRFDLSIVAAAMPDIGQDAADDLLSWLNQQDFINVRAPAYTYHDLIRSVFLEHMQNTDRQAVEDVHRRLRAHFERQLEANDRSERARILGVEVAYHALSANSVEPLADALRLLFRHLPTAYEYGIQWSRAINQVLDERPDFARDDRSHLGRLSRVLEESWLLSIPAARPGAEVAADPAMNILFSSSFDESLPTVNDSNAELWLSYLECRLRIVAGTRADLDAAFQELRRIWNSLAATTRVENLLAFRVATDLADIHTRRGELAEALTYSREAVAIAQAQGAPVWHAFALYQLGNNHKRQGAYQAALQSLSTAIALVDARSGRSNRYYRGRFLLDRAITLTYLNDARAAEESFEAARAAFAGSSPISYAELSHRVGWLKRTRGDLEGSLVDHETAISTYEELSSALHIPDGRTSAVNFLLGKALHSTGNVFADMNRHAEALSTYERAIVMFRDQGGIRHEAIVLKDRAWCRVVVDGVEAAEEDLTIAIRHLGPQDGQSERPAVNAATHLAEAWLILARIRCCAGALALANEALDRALSIIGDEPNPPLLAPAQLQIGLVHALGGATSRALLMTRIVSQHAERDRHWMLVARAALIDAVAYARVGDETERDRALDRAHEYAARWNQFEWRVLMEHWTRLERIVSHMTPSNPIEAPRLGSIHVDDQEEFIDIYDENGAGQGQASSRSAHEAGLWHRSFHCWIAVRDPGGDHKILLQRRGPFAKSFANYYDISVAGHYKAGEGIEGGIRECREELGIDVAPEELRLIAKRVINETLYNGMINREFQDIYVLERDRPIESYDIGYPELSAVVECSLAGLTGVVSGAVVSAPCAGRTFDAESDGLVSFQGRLTQADLIAEARAYHQAVLPLITRVVDRSAGPGEPNAPIRLDDGSLWSEL